MISGTNAVICFRALFGALFCLISATPQPSFADQDGYVVVMIDEARLVRLDTDAAQLIVGNPAIADVTAQDARLLVVTGKSFGTTNLIALDREGREIVSVRLSVKQGQQRQVTLYRGTARQSYHCAPDCQRTLSIGDDKTQFEQLAESVSRKFGVVNSAIGDSR